MTGSFAFPCSSRSSVTISLVNLFSQTRIPANADYSLLTNPPRLSNHGLGFAPELGCPFNSNILVAWSLLDFLLGCDLFLFLLSSTLCSMGTCFCYFWVRIPSLVWIAWKLLVTHLSKLVWINRQIVSHTILRGEQYCGPSSYWTELSIFLFASLEYMLGKYSDSPAGSLDSRGRRWFSSVVGC